VPRKTKRRTLAKGVYTDGHSIEVRVQVRGVSYTKRLPPDLTTAEAIAARKRLAARADTEQPSAAARHTLAFDVPRYLKLHQHQVSYTSKRAALAHWCALHGDKGRHRLTKEDVLAARSTWLQKGAAPKTINHRVNILRHLYATFDGPRAKTPCDDIPALDVPKTPIQRVSDALILAVDRELQLRERHHAGRPFDGAKTRARFRVLVSTGRRPSEVQRAKPEDVDLENRVWVVRDGKGGWSPGLYLNDDMLAAWTLFIEANAWGYYNTSSFAVTLRHAGWPGHIRPYNARHTTWITATERGADMADVQMGAGHKDLKTTRNHYTGVRGSRMQRLSEMLEGRFSGFPVADESGDGHKS
jgi:integrase